MGAYPSATLQASRIWNLPQNIASDIDGLPTISFGGNHVSSTEALKSLKARTKNTRAAVVSAISKEYNAHEDSSNIVFPLCGAIGCGF